MSLPNKHHYVVDLSPFGLENDNEVFHADDRPYGLIEASVLAPDAPPAGPVWGPIPPRRIGVSRIDTRSRELATSTTTRRPGGSPARSSRRLTARGRVRLRAMREVGLEVRRDAFGNLYGRLGRGPTPPAGGADGLARRHDAQRGRYDGVVGVLGADRGGRVRLRDEVCGARSRSSGSRARSRGSASGCIGSRAVMGELVARRPRPARDRDGVRSRGAAPARASSPTPSDTAGWDRPRSTRSSNCTSSRARPRGLRRRDRRRHRDRRAPRSAHRRCRGAATTPVRRRWRCAATRWQARPRRWWSWRSSRWAPRGGRRSAPSASCACAPGRSTSCPGEVEFDVDVRDSDGRSSPGGRRRAPRRARALAAKRGLTATSRRSPRTSRDLRAVRSSRPPTRRARRPRRAYRHMISGAYHDALILVAEDPGRDAVRPQRGRDQPPPRRTHRPRGHRPRRRRAGRGPGHAGG